MVRGDFVTSASTRPSSTSVGGISAVELPTAAVMTELRDDLCAEVSESHLFRTTNHCPARSPLLPAFDATLSTHSHGCVPCLVCRICGPSIDVDACLHPRRLLAFSQREVEADASERARA